MLAVAVRVVVVVAAVAVMAAAAAAETKWLLAHKELSVWSRASLLWKSSQCKFVQAGDSPFFDRQTDSRLLSLLRCNFFRLRAQGFEAWGERCLETVSFQLLAGSYCFFLLFVLLLLLCRGGNADVMPLLSHRFINARRRIVQPMIDQSNRAGQSSLLLAI